MIQHWTPDTTTQSRLMGGQALAAGISGGVKSLTDSIEEGRKARKTEADLATSLRKKLTILNPDRKDEFSAMGLSDLTGEDMAHAEQVLGERRKMEQDQWKQRSEAFNMQQQEFSRNRMNEEGFNRDLGGLMKLDPQSPELGNYYENPEQYPNGRPSRTPGLMEVLGAASRHGQAMNPQLDNILTSLQRAQPKGEFDPTQALPIRGAAGHRVVQTSAGQFQVLPPEKADKPLLKPYPGQNSDSLDEKIAGIRSISDPEQRRLAIEEANDMEVLKGRPSMLEKLLMGNLDGDKGPAKPAGTQASPHLPNTTAEAAKLKPGEWFKTPDGRLIQRK